MLFFIHASSREKHPESSSLVFKTSFCCDSAASLPAQHQDHSQDPFTAPLLTSTSLTLWQELFRTSLLLSPGAIPHHRAWFCSSPAEDVPQELPQLQYFPLLIHSFLQDHGRDIQAPHYWSHSLPRLVELGQGLQWSGLAPSPLWCAGRERSWSQICVWN